MEYEHEFEHSFSCEKPSSEDHAWSFKMACDACLAEIEVRHGVDWKVTDVLFEDQNRETTTHSTWDGKRTWKCTHKVKALYNVVHRLQNSVVDLTFIEESLTINYKMKNINYKLV
ncbi:hypothetical protein [Clostridium tagluense]|uniref:hypothetical protein n=1 Tax=Clostridium tagluense TaxID=360422 RepID=UPI001C6E06AD|nr:hypothetical protein [Clostridium tagluense]MBW9158890.1 hypothetical protein [Clostridium tagluense]WLC67133.1 hypothetical protein KTC93_08130 [Clostridium tagluense]